MYHKVFISYVIGIPDLTSPPGQPVILLSGRKSGVAEEVSATDKINLSWQSLVEDGQYLITDKKYVHTPQFRIRINASLFHVSHVIRTQMYLKQLYKEIRFIKVLQCSS